MPTPNPVTDLRVRGAIPPIGLPQRILLALDFADLSARSAADRMEVAAASVQNWASGRANPNLPTLRELARVCDVDSDWLIGDYKGPQRRQKPATNAKCAPRDSNPEPAVHRPQMLLFPLAA